MQQQAKANGMRTFTIIWLGQLVSLVGSGLFMFAVGVWFYQKTESATLFALITLFDILPGILIGPFAGTVVDRSDRRQAMILGDCGAAVGTLAVALIIWSGTSAVWLIYPALVLSSSAMAFQWPAYEASIPLLAPKEQLGRVNGMMQLARALARVAAPLLAGVLIVVIGFAGLVVIDFVTFLFAIGTLLLVQIPNPETTSEGQEEQGSVWRETVYGWNYVKKRIGLLSLLVLGSTLNFFASIALVLFYPLILQTFDSEPTLGTLLSIGGVGSVIGGLVMTRWGGTERKINMLLGFAAIAGLCMALYGMQPSVPPIAVGVFGLFFCMPFIEASEYVIWQTKVPPNLLGRVIAMVIAVGQAARSLGLILAGPLADYVFEPLLAEGGALASSLGQVIGIGPGRGIGLMFIVMGALVVTSSLVGYLYPRLRLVEVELPDAIPDQDSEPGMTAEQETAGQEPALA